MPRTERAARRGPRQQAAADDRPADVRYDQFYTDPEVAAWCYELVQQYCDPNDFQVVEPSAGTGAFLSLLPAGTWAYDLDPKCAGVEPKDFLEVSLVSDRPVLVVGNPPFGQNASLAKRFFNHAAKQASVIAMS